jgi:hypothetical protein
MAAATSERAALVASNAPSSLHSAGSIVATKNKKESYRICSSTGELDTPFSLVRVRLDAEEA